MPVTIEEAYWEAAQALPEQQRAAFMYALLNYRFTGKMPEGEPGWLPAFIVIKAEMDLAEQRKEKARKMAQARWKSGKKQTVKPRVKQQFEPPTLEEIQEYVEEKKLGIDAQRFFDYYTERNWKLSGGVQMQSWRITAQSWEKTNQKKSAKNKREGLRDEYDML